MKLYKKTLGLLLGFSLSPSLFAADLMDVYQQALNSDPA